MSPRLAQLSAGLSKARRRVHLRRAAGGLASGFGYAAAFVLLCSIAAVLYALVKVFITTDRSLDRVLIDIAAVAVAGAFAAILGGALHALLRKPKDAEAAERLDLALASHNRIATAYDLLASGASSPLALAAIDDGERMLAGANARPLLDDVEWDGRRNFARLAAAAACWLAIIPIFRIHFGARPIAPGENQVAIVNPAPISNDTATRPPDQPPRAPVNPPERETPSTGTNPGQATPVIMPAMAAQSASNVGTSGGATMGKSGTGQPSSGAGAPKQQPNPPAAANKPEQSKPLKGSGMGGGVQGASTGSVGSGGKGSGGAALSVEKESSRQDAADKGIDQDAAGENPEADENNENKHRGGAQPLRQDRVQAPARELGIGGIKGKDQPGKGRGGPTPAKKARGAGSLFLGVPIPDFVPGKLMPGTSKLSRENIKPQKSDLPAPAPAEVAPRSADEGVIERYDVSPQEAEPVLRYFQLLHRENETSATQPAAVSAAQGANNP